MQFRHHLYEQMTKHECFAVHQNVLGKRSQLFCVPVSSQKAVKLLDNPDKLLDYFERQVVTKKVDSRGRLEVRFAIGTCKHGDEIDEDYMSSGPNSVWDDEAGFDAPAIILTHKDQSKHSQDHPGMLDVLGIVQLIQNFN